MLISLFFIFFFFNDTATTEIYTLSLHDALPIFWRMFTSSTQTEDAFEESNRFVCIKTTQMARSEEHTSELQSQSNLVCRLLLEKKKKTHNHTSTHIQSKNAHQLTSSYLR